MLIIIAFAALAAAGAAFYLRRAVAFADQAPPSRMPPRAELHPTRHIDTEKLRAIPLRVTRVWEFSAPAGACAFGRRVHGRRIEVENGVEPPSHRCGMTDCTCHYTPIADHRGNERRCGNERREELRFEETADRRSGMKPRRHLNTWTDAPLR